MTRLARRVNEGEITLIRQICGAARNDKSNGKKWQVEEEEEEGEDISHSM
jgi:hypothetical protein